jgi:hypothetical protein
MKSGLCQRNYTRSRRVAERRDSKSRLNEANTVIFVSVCLTRAADQRACALEVLGGVDSGVRCGGGDCDVDAVAVPQRA